MLLIYIYIHAMYVNVRVPGFWPGPGCHCDSLHARLHPVAWFFPLRWRIMAPGFCSLQTGWNCFDCLSWCRDTSSHYNGLTRFSHESVHLHESKLSRVQETDKIESKREGRVVVTKMDVGRRWKLPTRVTMTNKSPWGQAVLRHQSFKGLDLSSLCRCLVLASPSNLSWVLFVSRKNWGFLLAHYNPAFGPHGRRWAWCGRWQHGFAAGARCCCCAFLRWLLWERTVLSWAVSSWPS